MEQKLLIKESHWTKTFFDMMQRTELPSLKAQTTKHRSMLHLQSVP
jgi:hypothetical protein